MPATCHSVPEETHPTAPYSLVGTSKMQLNALTMTALKLHLKHFRALTTGNKATLVDCLCVQLQSSEDVNNP